MHWYTRRQFILALIGIPIILIFLRVVQKDSSISYEEFINRYRTEEYSGLVIAKYIDRDEHNYQKVILKHEYGERILLFNHETGGLFNYIEVGDSLVKKNGTLDVNILRENFDTTITMRFTWKNNEP